MVSTGWRTAATVIIIIVGAALLTFTVYIWRRQKMMRRAAQHPEMQQRFMSSYAGDPEAHTPLLYVEATPPLPPKTQLPYSLRDRTGDVDEWGVALRDPPRRVPVPSTPDRAASPAVDAGTRPRSNPEAAIPMPEPSVLNRLFPTPALLQFPKIQFSRSNSRVGRIPSLHIQFMRESSQVVSSPITTFPEPDRRASIPHSASSAPSTLSRPFATMSASPLPPLPPISPISISRSSPTSVAVSEPRTERSDSIGSVGHNLFARKATGEDASLAAFSRNSSQQSRPTSSPATVGRGNGSASSSGSSGTSGAGVSTLRRATTWTPNVLASYSPWKGVVEQQQQRQDGWAAMDGQQSEAGESAAQVESPTGQIRVADAYRPMPTLAETPENVATPTIPRTLSEIPASAGADARPPEPSSP